MTIRPAYRPKIVKKRTKKFIRHQSDRYAKLSVSVHFGGIINTMNITSYYMSQHVISCWLWNIDRVNTEQIGYQHKLIDFISLFSYLAKMA